LVGAEFDDAVGAPAGRWLGADDRRLALLRVFLRRGSLLGVRSGGGLVGGGLVRGSFVGSGLVGRLLLGGFLLGFLGEVLLTDVLAVADAEHHDDVVRLLLPQQVARDVPPVEVVLGIVAQQA